jgi:cytosine deaminase
MQGHGAVGHAHCLGELQRDRRKGIAAILAESGVTIMTDAPGIRRISVRRAPS